MKKKTIQLFMSLSSALVMLTGSSQAANSFYEIGDLVLYFQKPGNNNTVYVSLGNAANNFRGAAAGATADRQSLNILNINQTLTDAFGASWASDPNVYAGAAAAYSSSGSLSTSAVFAGDQHRTLYLSRGRGTVGTVGLANSATYDLNQAQTSTAGATNIIGMGNTFEVNGTAQQQILTVDVSTIDDQNPISLGLQGTAFNAISGGIQQRGSATTIGNFGYNGDVYAENVEFALDLYRVVPRNDSDTNGEISGQKLVGSFEGTLAIGANGNVSFITIPEPSTIALSGLAALGLAFRRRRHS